MIPQDVQTKVEKYYSELSIKDLFNYAEGWVKKHPCIEQIELYKAGLAFEKALKYIIVAKAPELYFANAGRFTFEYKTISAEGKRSSLKRLREATAKLYPELKEVYRYHDWAASDSCDNVSNDLIDCYKIDDEGRGILEIEADWMWFKINIGEKTVEYNERANDFIREKSQIILYPQTRCEPEKHKETSLEIDFFDLLQNEKICPGLEEFYERLTEWVKFDTNDTKTMQTVEQDKLYQYALDCFDEYQNSGVFLKLSKALIDEQGMYEPVKGRRRKIIGTILQRYLVHNCQIHKKIIPPAEDLKKIHNKIIKEH